MTPVRSARRLTATALTLALAGAGVAVTAIPAAATVTPDAAVVIDEVYGGGGNSGAAFDRDFIEVHNRSAETVSLAGWSVQYTSAAGAAWQTTPLGDVSLAAGGTLLVGQARGTNTSLPTFTPDVDGSIPMSGTGGKVALVSSTTALSGATGIASRPEVVDFVGWGAAGDWTGTGAAPATTNATAITRTDHVTTADNAKDFRTATPTPTSSGSGPVDPTDPEDTVAATIAEVQGAGDASPLVGKRVVTSGVVTATYPVGGFNGFVIQTPGTGGALDLASHTTSDAVFVYSPQAVGSVEIGDHVEITGEVSEFAGLTEITATADGIRTLDAADAPLPALVAWPADANQREALESMLIAPQGDFTVSDTYTTMQYGDVALAAGTTPLRQPTDVARPGSPEASAVITDNADRRIALDDGASTNFTNAANSSLTPPYVSLTEPVTVGARVSFDRPVIVDFRNNAWKFNPTTPLVGDGTGADDGVTFQNIRTTGPEDVGGDVSVASFNVLNYFTTLGVENPSCVPYTDRAGNGVTVKEGCAQRGAWGPADFDRQQTKIVAAINGLDAAVVGLMEIENSAALGEEADEALGALVAALNAAAGEPRWAFIPSAANLPPVEQQDVITNAIIYQPALATPVGTASALADQSGDGQAFGNAREPIAQTFRPADGGETFTVVVNHFKSKGSVGPWPGDKDTGDGQGTSVVSRVRQAQALAAWVATDPTATGASAQILLGDFNSYGQEDPMQVLYDAGFVDAERAFERAESSYVFQGLSGSLDHVLLNPAARERATGADIWNVNSGEALALEYSRFNSVGTTFWAGDPYRSSDHDPVKVGLKAGVKPTVASSVKLVAAPPKHSAKHPAKLQAIVKTKGKANGVVEFREGSTLLATVTLTNGPARYTLPTDVTAGEHTYTATFIPADPSVKSSSGSVTVTAR